MSVLKSAETYGGIDPGKRGRLVLYDGQRIVRSDEIPYTGSEIDAVRLVKILIRWKRLGCRFAVVELQRSYGVEGQSRLQTLLEGYGALKALTAVVGIPIELVEPYTADGKGWKNRMRIPSPDVKVGKAPRKPKGAKPDTPEYKAWEEEKAKAKKTRDSAKRARKVKLKEFACAYAKRLLPGYEFRRAGSDKDDDGEAEAFLMSVLAMRIYRGSSG